MSVRGVIWAAGMLALGAQAAAARPTGGDAVPDAMSFESSSPWRMPIVRPERVPRMLEVAGTKAGRMPVVDPVLSWRGISFGAEPEPVKPPAAPDAKVGGGAPAPAKTAGKPPSLDELLGIKPRPPASEPAGSNQKPQPTEPAKTAPDRGREDLDASLRDKQIEDNFESAVDLMGRSAARINGSEDAGLETQRLQQDALRKLDALISQFQKQRDNNPNNSSSSSSSSSQNQQQQQGQPKPGQADRQSSADAQRAEREHNSDSRADAEAPARRDAVLRPGLEAAKSAWGALPARLRELLLQGSGEKFSQSYEQMTEEYYKRLAEQKP